MRVAAFAAVVLVAGAMSGCNKGFHVDLPQDFHGPVMLLCGPGQDQPADVHVPLGGSASGVPCPSKETEIAVTRGGQRVAPESKPVWQFRGDGVPVSIAFSVK